MRVLEEVITISGSGFLERVKYVADDKLAYRQGVKDCLFWMLAGALGVVLVVAFICEVIG